MEQVQKKRWSVRARSESEDSRHLRAELAGGETSNSKLTHTDDFEPIENYGVIGNMRSHCARCV